MVNPLSRGALLPWFHASLLNGDAAFPVHALGGKWLVLLCLGTAAHELAGGALNLVSENADLLDDERASFLGVSVDPSDVDMQRISRPRSGIRWALDFERSISRHLGALDADPAAQQYIAHWLLCDPMLRVRRIAPLPQGKRIFAALRRELAQCAPAQSAPLLNIPDVLGPDLCARLIEAHTVCHARDIGFMANEAGRTVRRHDPVHKRRLDCFIEDRALIAELRGAIQRTVRPMVRRAFQFEATRIERWNVACYDARDAGHFRAHRDDQTAGTAHRRFACSFSLSDEYEGGALRFPEFGDQTYRTRSGGVLVFSSSLLHEVAPVTRGKRYVFLPFLYDEAAARLREENTSKVEADLQGYRMFGQGAV